jgi:hypothetical protein
MLALLITEATMSTAAMGTIMVAMVVTATAMGTTVRTDMVLAAMTVEIMIMAEKSIMGKVTGVTAMVATAMMVMVMAAKGTRIMDTGTTGKETMVMVGMEVADTIMALVSGVHKPCLPM